MARRFDKRLAKQMQAQYGKGEIAEAAHRLIEAELHPIQELALEARMSEQYDEILFGGAMSGGKTHFIMVDVLLAALDHYPGDKFCVVRAERTMLMNDLWGRLRKYIPPQLLLGGTPKMSPIPVFEILTVLGDQVFVSEIYGIGASDPERVRGPEYRGIYVDEGHQVDDRWYTMALSRLRVGRDTPSVRLGGRSTHTYMFISSNPAPGYLKERFIEQPFTDDEREIEARRHRLFIPALPKDNPFIDREKYRSRFLNFSDAEFNRYWHGSWSIFEGMVYTELDRSAHVREINPEVIEGCRLVQGMDWGHTNPAAVIFCAMDAKGRIYVYDEIYRAGLRPDELFDMYQMKCDALGIADDERHVVMDSTTTKRERDGGSAFHDFVNLGMRCQMANNTRQGIHTIKMLLGRNNIVIDPKCQNLLREMAELKFDRETEIQHKKNDHAPDAFRYAINYLVPPRGAEAGAAHGVTGQTLAAVHSAELAKRRREQDAQFASGDEEAEAWSLLRG